MKIIDILGLSHFAKIPESTPDSVSSAKLPKTRQAPLPDPNMEDPRIKPKMFKNPLVAYSSEVFWEK